MGSLRKNCKTFGCKNLHRNKSGYCDECERKLAKKMEADSNRPSFRERGYTSEWSRFAKQYVLNHPTCAICGAPSKVCDHKDMPADIMLEVYGGKFDYDESHYQALCVACNTRKGKREDRSMRDEYHQDMERLKSVEG